MPKPPKPLERSLQAAVLRKLKAWREQDPGLVFRKRHGSVMGTIGDPDIYGLYHGLHFEIELKTAGHEPTLLQRARLAGWGSAGALTGVVSSIEEFQQFTENLRAIARK
jgi:hypothetical protein